MLSLSEVWNTTMYVKQLTNESRDYHRRREIRISFQRRGLSLSGERHKHWRKRGDCHDLSKWVAVAIENLGGRHKACCVRASFSDVRLDRISLGNVLDTQMTGVLK